MRAAIVENGVVTNVIIIDAPEDFPEAIVNEDAQIGWAYNGTDFLPPPGNPLFYTFDNLTKQWIFNQALSDAYAIVQAHEADMTTTLAQAKADAFVQNFINMTFAEAGSYIDTNVTDLNSAKAVLKKLTLMMLYFAKQKFK